MKRDLHADLAICNAATAGHWAWGVDTGESLLKNSRGVPFVFISEPGITDADARFIAEARTGWPHAIERALAAEAERDHAFNMYVVAESQCRRLEKEVDNLRKIVAEECPVAAFDLVTSLRAEKAHTMEYVAELEAEIKRLKQSEEKLIETLRYYADLHNYEGPALTGGHEEPGEVYSSWVDRNHGQRARDVLRELGYESDDKE